MSIGSRAKPSSYTPPALGAVDERIGDRAAIYKKRPAEAGLNFNNRVLPRGTRAFNNSRAMTLLIVRFRNSPSPDLPGNSWDEPTALHSTRTKSLNDAASKCPRVVLVNRPLPLIDDIVGTNEERKRNSDFALLRNTRVNC